MSNSLEFVRLYNETAEWLCKLTNSAPRTRFYALVDRAAEANNVVKRYSGALKRFGDLRNAIVHDGQFPDRIVAEVHPDVLEEFRRIVELIKAPPKVIPRFRREVRVFGAGERLTECLRYMKDHDYSQVVVNDGRGHRLLSHEGIARWLGEAVSAGKEGMFDARLKDVLKCELPESCAYLSQRATVFDALDILEHAIERQTPRVHAILITSTGDPAEPPLGIITPWDLIGVSV